MPQRNNPMSAVQKKKNCFHYQKKGNDFFFQDFPYLKKEQVKHRTVMPTWLRNILAVIIVGCFSVAFYYFFYPPLCLSMETLPWLKGIWCLHP